MPKQTTTKTRRVRVPASLILRPTTDDIALHGTSYDDAPLPDNAVIAAAIGAELPVTVAVNGIACGDLNADTFAPVAPAIENVQPDAALSATAQPSTLNDRALARAAAAKAVAAFYAGKSLPFKSAFDLKRKAAINFALNRDPSARSAALIAAIVTYCDVQPGTLQFVRGSGRVPRKLIHPDYTGDDMLAAGPESGGLSNLMPDRVQYVSGALAGPGCENAVFRLIPETCIANLRAFNEKQSDGEHLHSAPIALIEMLAKPVPDAATETPTPSGDAATE